MEGRTPREQLLHRGYSLTQVERILDFPTLHLDESFSLLEEHFRYFQLQLTLTQKAQKNPLWIEDRKELIDFITKYPEKNLQLYAQNVLTYYLLSRKKSEITAK